MYPGALPAETVLWPGEYGGRIALLLSARSEELAFAHNVTGYTDAQILLKGQKASKKSRGKTEVVLPDERGNILILPEEEVLALRVRLTKDNGLSTFPSGDNLKELVKLVSRQSLRGLIGKFAVGVSYRFDERDRACHVHYAIGGEEEAGEHIIIPFPTINLQASSYTPPQHLAPLAS